MIFKKKSIGVEVSASGVAFALTGGTGKAPVLERTAIRLFPAGVVTPSLCDTNVTEPQKMAEYIREAFNLLIYAGNRVHISLPDSVGRAMLMNLEERFKSRSEGIDLIRWKLKKNMPLELADAHLDYKLLNTRENGEISLLVCMVSKAVIEQYENAFLEAGLSPGTINLNIFNLCRTNEQKLELIDSYAFICLYYNHLGIMIISNNEPVFIRFKKLPEVSITDSRLHNEIRNSMLLCHKQHPAMTLAKAACLAHPAVSRQFCEMVANATGLEIVPLDACHGLKFVPDVAENRETLFPFSAAIGAALRGL